MKSIFHPASRRGHVEHGWLSAHHSFSFGSYYDPERIGFGLLKVLNDDVIQPAKGFSTHPHQNMEIVTIPLHGSLRHKDSEGHEAIIRHGEVQLMSAGTGVEHSEFNASTSEVLNLLQIWVLPKEMNIQPRYDQKSFPESSHHNQFQLVVSPLSDSKSGLKINQQAYFSLAHFEKGKKASYHLLSPLMGVYLFLISGEIQVLDKNLKDRDALGVEDLDSIEIKFIKDSQLLVIEVPMR